MAPRDDAEAFSLTDGSGMGIRRTRRSGAEIIPVGRRTSRISGKLCCALEDGARTGRTRGKKRLWPL